MIAQAMVEYGVIQSISAAFMKAFNRVEYFLSTGNARYFVFAALILIIVLLWRGRPTK